MSRIITLHDLGCNARRINAYRAFGAYHPAACYVLSAGCCGTRDCGPPKTRCNKHPLKALPAEEGLPSSLSSDLVLFKLPERVGNCIVSGRTPEDKIRSVLKFARGYRIDPSHFFQDFLQQYSTSAEVAELVSRRISEIVPRGKFLELCAGNAVISTFLCLDGHSGTGVEIDRSCKGKLVNGLLTLQLTQDGRLERCSRPGPYQHLEGSALDLTAVRGDFDFSVMSPPFKGATDFILSALSRTNLVFVLIPTHQEKERLVRGRLQRTMEELPHTFHVEELCRQRNIGWLPVDTFLDKTNSRAWHLEEGVDSYVTLYMLYNKFKGKVVSAGQYLAGLTSQDGSYEKELANLRSLHAIGHFIVSKGSTSSGADRDLPSRDLSIVPTSMVARPCDGLDAFSTVNAVSPATQEGDLLIQSAARSGEQFVTTYSNGKMSFHLETALEPAPVASSCSYREDSSSQAVEFCGKTLQGTLQKHAQ